MHKKLIYFGKIFGVFCFDRVAATHIPSKGVCCRKFGTSRGKQNGFYPENQKLLQPQINYYYNTVCTKTQNLRY